jgi:hypothetical protein
MGRRLPTSRGRRSTASGPRVGFFVPERARRIVFQEVGKGLSPLQSNFSGMDEMEPIRRL